MVERGRGDLDAPPRFAAAACAGNTLREQLALVLNHEVLIVTGRSRGPFG